MSLWRQLKRGIAALLNRKSADRDLSDEVDHYLEQSAAAHVASGMQPGDARRAAQAELGSRAAIRQEVRGSGWEATLESLVSDVRYAGRMLRKSPAFAAIAILVIALGTGAVTTIFSATNAMLLRPLPLATDASRLFSIDRKHRNGKEGMSASYGYYKELRDKTHSFDGIAAWNSLALTIADGGNGTVAYGNIVSGNYFSVLGVHPALGRFFAPEEDATPLTHPVIVVSHGFWTAKLGGDSSAIGRSVQVNGHPFTIIGVAPAGFRGVYIPLKLDAWVPLMMAPQLWPGHDFNDPADISLRLFARLKPGVTREAARQEVSAITAARVAAGVEPMPWVKNYVDGRLVPLSGLPEDATNAIIGFFFLLLGASALVLLIASVNVGSMLSARAISRRREMAVRAALGAGRGRLIRQLLTETLFLFGLGAAGGVAIAVAGTKALERLPLPDEILLDLAPDYRVIAFAFLAALVTGIAFGLPPALQAARADISHRVRENSVGGGMRRSRLGNALVIAQLSLSLLLLVGAGLFLRALDRANRIDPGFDANGVTVVSFNTESYGYDDAKGRAFYAALRRGVEAMPGVEAVTYAGYAPLTFQEGSGIRIRTSDQGPAPAGTTGDAAGVRAPEIPVDANYFDVLRIPIAQGAPIAARDDEHAANVAVVNETLAKLLWHDANAVGRTFFYGTKQATVIGVARNAKYATLTEDRTPFVYFPMAQQWAAWQVMLVRSSGAPDQVANGIAAAVRAIDPALPRPVTSTLHKENAIVLLPQRVAAMVSGALGLIGLIMATVGLYGIIAYSVSRRTREIGIRVALGARRQEVLGMVVREGMKLAGIGVLIGLVLAAGVTRLMSSFLFNVSPLDMLTFVGMSLLFMGVAFVSSYLPARRAAMTDPMAALRTD